MGWGEWVLAGLVALAFVFVILRPDLWGRRSTRRSGDGTAVGGGFESSSHGGRRRDDDDDGESDSDSGDGGDGGGGD